jgi:hypothetical protein
MAIAIANLVKLIKNGLKTPFLTGMMATAGA